MTGRRARWVVAALASLIGVWTLLPAAVPIYDGPGFPDEPYRYVQPPAGARKTPPPTSAHATIKVNGNGLSAAGYSNSLEQGPQIVLYIPTGALKAPAGAKSITISETPLAPSPPLPTDGTIAGNIYRVAATTAQGPVQIVGGSENQIPTLQMRSPSARQPGPVFEHRTPTGWVRQSTLRIGQDIYQASAPVFGDWALVQLSSAATTKASSGGGVNVALLVSGIAVLLLVGIIVVIRRARTVRVAGAERHVQRRQQPDPRPRPRPARKRR